MKFLNRIGLYTKKQYEALESNFINTKKALEEKVIKLENQISFYKEDLKILPYKFDYLVTLYNDTQINSLAYKIINLCRNDKTKRYLLDRWDKRTKNAKESIVDTGVEEHHHSDE